MGQRSVEAAGAVPPAVGFDDGISLGDRMRGERATLGKSLLDVQRELRIKAAYIAAIENADASAFETPGFIAGYVRSYARYLGLDPDRAFASFCAESGFRPSHGATAPAATARRPSAQAPVRLAADRDIFADGAMPYAPAPDAMLSRIEPKALGSLAVLVALIGGVAWGGWTVLEQVQRVTLEPVADAPVALAEIDPLAPSGEAPSADAPSAEALDRLYRPRALDVPVLVARDGPIAALDPGVTDAAPAAAEAPAVPLARRDRDALDPRGDQIGPRPAPSGAPQVAEGAPGTAIEGAVAAALAEDGEAGEAEGVQVVADAGEGVVLVAVRPAWVRVRAPDGAVVLETVLEMGQTYAVERTETPATLRTGNAGAVYFAVGGQTYGPAGEGPSVASDIALSPEAVSAAYPPADIEGDPDLARMIRVAEAAPSPEAPAGPEPAPAP